MSVLHSQLICPCGVVGNVFSLGEARLGPVIRWLFSPLSKDVKSNDCLSPLDGSNPSMGYFMRGDKSRPSGLMADAVKFIPPGRKAPAA
jgi:hypothetical protein